MYQITKINEDTYKLEGNGKEYQFTRTVDLMAMFQSIDLKTTIKLADVLAERGETLDTTKLRVERTNGNETTIDESNLNMIRDSIKAQVTSEIIAEIFKKAIGKDILTVIQELNIANEDIEPFTQALTKVLLSGQDDTPRGEDKEGNREGTQN